MSTLTHPNPPYSGAVCRVKGKGQRKAEVKGQRSKIPGRLLTVAEKMSSCHCRLPSFQPPSPCFLSNDSLCSEDTRVVWLDASSSLPNVNGMSEVRPLFSSLPVGILDNGWCPEGF